MPRHQSTKRPPLGWKQVQRWLDCEDLDRWKRARVDGRLITIATAIKGLLEGVQGYGLPPAARRAEIVRLAKQALGTHRGRRADEKRTMIVCDWITRCALPLWLDRLPAWCLARESAKTLRGLNELLWQQSIIDALAALSPVVIALERAQNDRATDADRLIVKVTHGKAQAALAMVARALSGWLSLNGAADPWICQMAMWHLLWDHSNGDHDATVKQTLPALMEMLVAVQDGESQQSTADRCKWPALPKKKAA